MPNALSRAPRARVRVSSHSEMRTIPSVFAALNDPPPVLFALGALAATPRSVRRDRGHATSHELRRARHDGARGRARACGCDRRERDGARHRRSGASRGTRGWRRHGGGAGHGCRRRLSRFASALHAEIAARGVLLSGGNARRPRERRIVSEAQPHHRRARARDHRRRSAAQEWRADHGVVGARARTATLAPCPAQSTCRRARARTRCYVTARS